MTYPKINITQAFLSGIPLINTVEKKIFVCVLCASLTDIIPFQFWNQHLRNFTYSDFALDEKSYSRRTHLFHIFASA